MPTRHLEAYVEAMPRLQAQRNLQAAEQIAVGMGRLPKEVHKATARRWQRETGVTSQPGARTPRDLMSQLAAAGVRVVRVPRKPSPESPA
jgi:hypothetical protein